MKFKITSFNKFQNPLDVDRIEQDSVLHLAAKIGNLEIVKLLLEKKEIDINIKDSHGKKPIYYAVKREIIKLLSK